MHKQRISDLLQRYLQKTATANEQAEFARLLHTEQYKETFNELLDQNWDELSSEEIDALEIPGHKRILQEIVLQPQSTGRKKNLWPRLLAAAVVLVIFGTGVYLYSSKDQAATHEFSTKTDIAPGKIGATLTLANGKKIQINETSIGSIASEMGVKIVKTETGELRYEISDNNNGPQLFNTLSTSNGQQTQVRLQDGTLVYLNAASSLKYPTRFSATGKREVTLSGEAYFEVAKDKHHPFIVKGDLQQVEVLGTTFNINSYADEPNIKTTLLEGSVKISQNDTHNSKLLVPGEQAFLNSQLLLTKTVKVDDVVAWKDGYFMFNNETLESIMKKVARWYDVEIVYKDTSVKEKTFFGSVSRFEHVSEILKLLQKTGGATFEIKGKQIIISQK